MPRKPVAVTYADVIDALLWLESATNKCGRNYRQEPDETRRTAVARACSMDLAGRFGDWAEILPAGRAALQLVQAVETGQQAVWMIPVDRKGGG